MFKSILVTCALISLSQTANAESQRNACEGVMGIYCEELTDIVMEAQPDDVVLFVKKPAFRIKGERIDFYTSNSNAIGICQNILRNSFGEELSLYRVSGEYANDYLTYTDKTYVAHLNPNGAFAYISDEWYAINTLTCRARLLSTDSADKQN